MRKAKVAAALLAAVGMALCLAGCVVRRSGGGFSDISYADLERYTAGAAELPEPVEHIQIHWPVGSVTVKVHSGDTVSFSEKSAKELTDDALLRYWQDGTTLHIQFCQAGKWRLDEMEKELTVLVPEDLALTEVEVNTLSAPICLDGIRANRLTADTTSGDMRFTGCTVTEAVNTSTISSTLEADFTQPLGAFSGSSTSGSFQISAAAIESFSANSISGSVSLSIEEAPKALDIQTTSGSIDLTLPEDTSFTLDYHATSGELTSDLPYATQGGKYIFGDGEVEYGISAISGDVRILSGGK